MFIIYYSSEAKLFPPEAVGRVIDFLPQCEMCDLYNMSNDYKANKMTSFSLNFRVRRANSSMCHTQRCLWTISAHCLASSEVEALSREAIHPENTQCLFRGTGAGMQLYQVELQFFTVLKKSMRFSGLAFLRGTFFDCFYLLMPLKKLLLMQDRISCLGHSGMLSYLFSQRNAFAVTRLNSALAMQL